jgi:hypothetical protein
VSPQFHNSDLSGDLSRARTSGSLGGGGQIRVAGWMEEQFPAVLLNCPRGQNCSVRHLILLKDDSFLLRTFFTKRHSKLRCSCTDGYTLVLSDELVDFLLVALSCSSSLSTTARLMAMSVFPSLKCFTHLLTLLVPMQTSAYTPRSRSEMIYADFTSFTRSSVATLTKRRDGDSRFLAVHDWNVRGVHSPILRSCWRGNMPLMVL